MARKQNPDNPMPEHLKRNGGFVSVRPVAVSLYAGDIEILGRLADRWGCSKSEVVRTALRHLDVKPPLHHQSGP